MYKLIHFIILMAYTAPIIFAIGIVPADAADCPDRTVISYYLDKNQNKVIPVWISSDAVGFSSIMAVDVDGSPRAYNPANTGLDYICNSGAPIIDGKKAYALCKESSRLCNQMFRQALAEGFRGPTQFYWWGIVALNASGKFDSKGVPVVQAETHPAPGFYISMTSLVDPSKELSDPARFVDSTKIPYIVTPKDMIRGPYGIELGDFAIAHDPSTGVIVEAIVADIGPKKKLGEGSIELLRRLGHSPVTRHGRAMIGLDRTINYLIFPGTHRGWPIGPEDLRTLSMDLFERWGGKDRLTACTK